MTIYDFTHPLDNQTPVYPGSLKPEIRSLAEYNKEGYCEKWFGMTGHTGTHVDAPSHMIPDGPSLDRMPVSHFTGEAFIVPVPRSSALITTSLLETFSSEFSSADFVILKTGWSEFWGKEAYFKDFPALSTDAAEFLLTFRLKGIGIDTLSVDSIDSKTWPVHHILLKNGLIIIENLAVPGELKLSRGTFYCFPLKLSGGDGSPVRALLSS